MRAALLCMALAGPAGAESLCDVPADMALMARLSGDWLGPVQVATVNEVLDDLRAIERDDAIPTMIHAGGLRTETTERVWFKRPMPLAAAAAPLDVDEVDAILEDTEAEDFADLLSDTPCGPEALPQLETRIDNIETILLFGEGPAPVFDGTITLIPYFDDRILRLQKITVRSEERVVFLTAAALLTRVEEGSDGP